MATLAIIFLCFTAWVAVVGAFWCLIRANTLEEALEEEREEALEEALYIVPSENSHLMPVKGDDDGKIARVP